MARGFAGLRARMERIEGPFAGFRATAGSDGRAESAMHRHRVAPVPGAGVFHTLFRGNDEVKIPK